MFMAEGHAAAQMKPFRAGVQRFQAERQGA